MKVAIKLNPSEDFSKFIYIDEHEVFIQENDEKQVIETSYKDRFNTLISLFGLKNNWKNNSEGSPLYEIVFENNDNKEYYSFSNIPDNFMMFMGYVVKLVGDSL